MNIETATPEMLEEWVGLRQALWPEEPLAGLRENASGLFGNPNAVVFLARSDTGHAIGFAEATLRRDYVNGCETSPVAFVEGLYVAEDSRRRGVAQALCAAIAAWARAKGMRELASDVLLDNNLSQDVHEALGFAETERVVYYRKLL